VIASVSGTVQARRAGDVVIEAAGVGYRLAVSTETLRQVPAVGERAVLHSHLVVRDDGMHLFGFAADTERELFLMLIGVQSVGPKVALAVLSGGRPRELLNAIASGDVARFQAVPGIGKRTAERIIVELREKVAGRVAEDIVVSRALACGGRRAGLLRPGGREPARGRRRHHTRGADRRGAEGRPVSAIRTPGVQRVHDPAPLGPEEELDRSLRPKKLDDFVGQERVKDQLAVFIQAARARGEALDHVLLAGPPGLGKTSLAQIVANELEAEFVDTAGPALERKGDVASYLTALEPGSVFFVDEIHRLPRALEETFYPAMEDRRLPITVGQGAGARVVTLDLPEFTMIGATTRAGLLTTPLRDRFGVTHRLELYGPEDLARIVVRSAGILEIEVDERGAQAIASRSRGTPRVANRLLKRARDFAEVRGAGRIDERVAREALDLLEVDAAGLDRLDREILRAICTKFDGGPVGLSTLAVAVGEEADTIEDVYEPYLLQQGFLMRTPRGRVATDAAFVHLGVERPAGPGQRLF